MKFSVLCALVLGILLLLACAVVTVVATVREYMLATGSESWPSVEGRITESQAQESVRSLLQPKGGSTLRQPSATVVPKIRYEFAVEGITYYGRRIAYRDLNGRADTQTVLSQFPQGAEVTVYYAPGNPAEATLIRGGTANVSAWIRAGVFTLMAAGCGLLLRKNWDSRPPVRRPVAPAL